MRALPPAVRHSVTRDALPLTRPAKYGRGVRASSTEHWSLFRSLAFLAATFAIVFGAMLPSAVAASTAAGSPIVLCSGDQILVVQDADGVSKQRKPSLLDSLKCASCVLANFTALPPPPIHPVAPPRIVALQPRAVWASLPSTQVRTGLRPPSTAPPLA
jgi:hypothetical protein